MASKLGLGRGLEALIPETRTSIANKPDEANGIRMIAVGKLQPGPNQPRRTFDDETIRELAQSIKRHGIIQPLIVEEDKSAEGNWFIIAGERRWRAACEAGLKEVPVLIREFGSEKTLEIALIENIQREDLNPIDQAEAYRQLMETVGITQEELALRVGKSRPAVANSLRLLGLPEDSREALRSSQISAGHAKAILAVINPLHRTALLQKIIKDDLSVRQAETEAVLLNRGSAKKGSKAKAKESTISIDPDLLHLEQKLFDRLGTKVSIKGSINKGAINIEYFSMDDLERIFNIISNTDG